MRFKTILTAEKKTLNEQRGEAEERLLPSSLRHSVVDQQPPAETERCGRKRTAAHRGAAHAVCVW